jgi:very-short-patch-repair endonuclease
MAWDAELTPIRQALAAHGRKWWKILIGEYRQAKRDLAGLLTGPLPADLEGQLAIADAVLEVRWHRDFIRRTGNLGRALFGAQWQDEHSDFARLTLTADWVASLLEDLATGKLPSRVIDALERQAQGGAPIPHVDQLEEAVRAYEAAIPEVEGLLQIDPQAALATQPFTAQDHTLRAWRDQLAQLHGMARLNQFRTQLREAGLSDLAALTTWPRAGASLVAVFRQAWFAGLLETAYQERPALVHFNGPGHELVIERFRELDGRTVAYNRARLAHTHWQTLPRTGTGGQLGVLALEMNKKSRHLPIRKLMTKAGNAIQAIKPVFMMSPLSVATYLPPGSLEFDLVVFDEASQVRPVDAFGAILRGKQVVVVGDDRQMPPTDFFATQVLADGEAESVTEDLESILGLFAARMQKHDQRMLRWHYRSRHESLITVSNREFYDNKLVIFPSPDAGREELGLRFRHHPQAYYDRGGSATNTDEARLVAAAVMAHAKTRPDLTLGVAAFSQSQMRAIQDQLEILRRQDPSGEPYFASHPHEPFFVKNLETVQGDERDVIFISIGYGRTESGAVSMNFGPLNLDGGERRLNVLITRARLRCEVFTNLKAEDLDLSRTNARGVKALKLFLHYAETGRLDLAGPSGRPSGSPFEDAVKDALTARGYQVEPQVGAAGFFIDLALVDPARPGRYLLGIECDGASYHSARSARDRDRLRQQVLEGLGWRIHRIWSTDWFRTPDRELARLEGAIAQAREAAVQPPPPPEAPVEVPVVERETPSEVPAGTPGLPAYQQTPLALALGEQELHTVPLPTLVGWVTQVVETEGPVHLTEVARRITAAAGVKRSGVRIQRALDEAIDAAVRSGAVARDGEFLSVPDREVVLRDRSALAPAARKLEWIAPSELRLAILQVVATSYGIEPTQVPAAACKLMGFGRVSDEMKAQLDAQVQEMITNHQLELRGQHLVIAEA